MGTPELVTVVCLTSKGYDTRVETRIITEATGMEGVHFIRGAADRESRAAQAMLAAHALIGDEFRGATGSAGIQGPIGVTGQGWPVPFLRDRTVAPWVQREQAKHRVRTQRMDARGCR